MMRARSPNLSRGRCRQALTLLLVALVGALGGCNSILNGWFDPTEVGGFSRETTLDIRTSLSIQDTPLGIAGATDPTPDDLIPLYEEYRLVPGDVLQIRVFELLARLTETSAQAVVDEIGTISLPVLGQVRVAGMTRSELERELVEQLARRGILQDAQLTIDVAVKRNQTYTVFGAVSAPSLYPIPRPDTRLLEALTIAGGLPDLVTDIYIIRTEPNAARNVAPPGANPAHWSAVRAGADRVDGGWSGALLADTAGGHGATGGPLLAAAGREPPPPSTQSGDPPARRDDQEAILEAVRPQGVAGQSPPPPPAEAPPTTEPADIVPDRAAQPRWVYVNREFVEVSGPAATQQAPVPAPPQFPESVPPAQPPLLPPPAEPQIDWSRLAGEQQSRIIRISAQALRDGDYRHNVVMRPGDSVRLMAGQVGEYYIMGQVNRPGAYSLTGRQVTLKNAVAAAGNLAVLAWPDRCTIYRRYGDREEMHQVNLDTIFAGLEPDVMLKNNDLVLVGSHPLAPFLAVVRNAFRLTYGFGFVYDRNFADIDSFGSKLNPEITEASGQGTRFPNLFR